MSKQDEEIVIKKDGPYEVIAEWLLGKLHKAYLEAKKGKRGTTDEHVFELNWYENLVRLRDDIMNRCYKPGRGICFVIYDPVIREIFAAPFRDRIVHHFLYDMVAEWWDKHFSHDSYSCRKGKGTLFGQKRLLHHINSVTHHGSRTGYVIKLDLKGYFMSISRKKAYERVKWGLDRQFKNDKRKWLKEILEYLWAEVIFDDPTKNVNRRGSEAEFMKVPIGKSLFNQPPGYGIVIGNLSSQLISNIFLDMLDRYITFELGYKHYGRYVDDFYIIVSEDEYKKALKDLTKISDFLKDEMHLTLHPKKRYIQKASKGVTFTGVTVYPQFMTIGKRMKGNFHNAVYQYSTGHGKDETIISYLGHLKHIKAQKYTKWLFDKFGWEYHFEKR